MEKVEEEKMFHNSTDGGAGGENVWSIPVVEKEDWKYLRNHGRW